MKYFDLYCKCIRERIEGMYMVTIRDETGSLFSFIKTWKDVIFLFSVYSVLSTVMFMKTYKKNQLQKKNCNC